MIVFGWIVLILVILFGLFSIGILVSPYIIAEIKTFTYKVKKFIEDKQIDIDKRSEERRNRNETKRQKDFELKDKKLNAKLSKIDKQIKVLDEKQKIAKELKESLVIQKEEIKTIEPKEVEEVVIENENN